MHTTEKSLSALALYDCAKDSINVDTLVEKCTDLIDASLEKVASPGDIVTRI